MSARKKSTKAKTQYTVAVIGAGRIAALFDNPQSKTILTHAHAVTKNPATSLVGFVDANLAAAKLAAHRWSTNAFGSITELYKNVSPDIVIVATPDNTHFQVLRELIIHKPKFVICEKPLTTSLAESKKIIAAYKKAGIPLMVNFSRRFDDTVRQLRQDLIAHKYGRVLWSSLVYSKGISHNGSHAVDVARFLFGEVKTSKTLVSRSDFYQDDQTVGAFLTLQNCPAFYLVPGDEKQYSIFELDVACEKGRVRFTNSGFFVEKSTVAADPLFPGYCELKISGLKPTKLSRALSTLLQNAVNHLAHQTPLFCPGEDAIKTQQVCLEILKQSKKLK